MIVFDAAHEAVHYPPDRRFRIWLRPSFIVAAICLALIPLVLAWGQTAIFGLPYLAAVPEFHAVSSTGMHGFPWWRRWAHFFNFVFLMMLMVFVIYNDIARRIAPGLLVTTPHIADR